MAIVHSCVKLPDGTYGRIHVLDLFSGNSHSNLGFKVEELIRSLGFSVNVEHKWQFTSEGLGI